MRKAAFVLSSFVAALSAGCSAHSYTGPDGLAPTAVILGSGRFVSETRPVQGFSRVSVSGAGHVIVTHAASESLEITAEDNLMALVSATVSGNRLILGWKPGTGGLTSHGVEFRVGVRDLRGVEADGASRVDADAVDGALFGVTLNGASEFNASGLVDRLDLDLSGASRAPMADLTGRAVSARLTGASSALLRVMDSLVVTAAGSSTFEFLGDPAVQADASGLSIVRRVGP